MTDLAAKLRPWFQGTSVLWPALGLMALAGFNLAFAPGFFHLEIRDGHLYGTLVDILNQGSKAMLLAIGMTLVIATGGVDLSVGSVMAIAGAVAATLLTKTTMTFASVCVIALGAALTAGICNGCLVGWAGIQPIIATLILMVAGRGVAMLLTGGQVITFEAAPFVFLGNGHFLGLPFTVALALGVLGAAWLATRRTAIGLFLEAVGDNERAARLCGINTALVKVSVYGFSGFCAGVAGLIAASNIKAADSSRVGEMMELDAIFAVVVGGTPLTGGRFNLAGSVIGALLLQTLTTTMYDLGVPPSVATVPKAIVIVVVCLMQSARFRAQLGRFAGRRAGARTPLVKTRTGDAPAYSLSSRGTTGERVGERSSRFAGLPHAREPQVTPLPGPLPIRSSWGEGEEKRAAVGHAFLTKWERGRGVRRLFQSRHLPLTATVLVLAALFATASLLYPGFCSRRVAANLLADNAFLGIAAVGMTFVILSGGIDLSVGSTLAFTTMLMAVLVQGHHIHPLFGITIVLATGAIFGAGMGFLIAEYDLPPFLVTLGGMFFARGMAFALSQESIGIDHPFYARALDFGIPLGGRASLPATALVFLAAFGIGVFVNHFTPFGRNVFALGGNESSARLMGVPVRTVKISVYALSGFCSALAGVVATLYMGAGNPTMGVGFELDVIASVVIGGTLLTGGVGTQMGSLTGVLIFGTIQTALIFDGRLNSWWLRIAIGGLLLAFILFQRFLSRTPGLTR